MKEKSVKILLWVSSIFNGIMILTILDSFTNILGITGYLATYSYLAPYDTLFLLLLVNIVITIIAKIKSKPYPIQIKRWASTNLIISIIFWAIIFALFIFLIWIFKASPL